MKVLIEALRLIFARTLTFFFSSRRRHTRYIGDWSSDVCSSDLAYAHAGVEPQLMGLGPIPAVKRVFEKAGLKPADMDVIESNEAFAVQAMAVTRDLGLDPAKVNPNGGAVALGHPIGATGCILTVKAIYELHRTGKRYALVTMCIGGGQGIAAIFERM